MPNQLYTGITDQTLPAQFTKQYLPSMSTIHSITQTHVQLKTNHLQPIQNHSSTYVFTSIPSPIIANISLIETFDNSSSEQYKSPEKYFIEQTRLAKKRKVKIKFEREDYMVSLRKALDAIDGKCIVCIFCNGRRIYTIPLIFMVQYVLAIMSHKSMITYINGFHREH